MDNMGLYTALDHSWPCVPDLVAFEKLDRLSGFFGSEEDRPLEGTSPEGVRVSVSR